VIYRGNFFSGGASVAGGTADLKNNVERVAVTAPLAGTWTLQVTGSSVPQGPSGYAICATGRLAGGFTLAEVASYGTGKPGLAGVPVLTGTLPLLPSTFLLRASNTRPNSIGLAVFGLSQTALPFDGGTVLADPMVLEPVLTNFVGFGDYTVNLPASPSLNGATTYWQFWMPGDPGASGDGWAASPGLRMTMGN
jgi:hypothetical protein